MYIRFGEGQNITELKKALEATMAESWFIADFRDKGADKAMLKILNTFCHHSKFSTVILPEDADLDAIASKYPLLSFIKQTSLGL